MSAFNPEAKRRKTEVEKQAEKEKKAELAESADPTAEWVLSQRQPWAEKQVQPARPTEEQLAWLKEEGFIKEEEEGEKEGLSKTPFLYLSIFKYHSVVLEPDRISGEERLMPCKLHLIASRIDACLSHYKCPSQG